MALLNTYRGQFFDENGKHAGKKGFNRFKKWFKFKDGAYNIVLGASYIEDHPIPLLWKRRTYYYPLDDSNPVTIDGKPKPAFTPQLYDINLETEVAKQLNDLQKKGLSDLLTGKNLMIVGAGILIAIYFLKGGTIS